MNTSKITLAALVLSCFVLVLAGCGTQTAQDIEYSTIAVPSDQISIFEYWHSFPRRSGRWFRRVGPGGEYRYWVGLRGPDTSFGLEANSEQYHELRNTIQSMGSGSNFSVLPEHARGERRYVMVELHYIPGASNRPSRYTRSYTGLLVGVTVLFDYNTVTLPADTLELTYTRTPPSLLTLGYPRFIDILTNGDDLNLQISRSQHRELTELLERRNITLELHYRVQTGRLMEFIVLDE